jgi:hypothetical protein
MTRSTVPTSVTDLLPPPRSCTSLHVATGDVLIHAPGFEDRTMAIVDSVTPTGAARAVLLDYRPYNPRNRLREVRGALLAKGVQITDEDIIVYDRFEPGDFEVKLKQRLLASAVRSAVVDVSSMSKLAIMLVLHVCRQLELGVRILYTEAQTYAPSEEEFNSARDNKEIHRPTLQVFTGVHGVVRVDSLASVAMQGQPTAALVFMSFNDALTQILLNTVYPSRLFLINGRPPMHKWREAATAWIHDQVRHEWAQDNPVSSRTDNDVQLPKRFVSTLDYRQTVSLLIQLYWALSDRHRILLAPAGSKMQAVGCYLVKALHPDIHIEYPSPEGFSRSYSSDIGKRWLVDFGRFSERLSAIADAERHEYLEISTSLDTRI